MTDNESMPFIENSFAAIVITAQTFNPSIFTETWLTQNGIIPVEVFVGLRIFSAEVVQFQTSDLQVLVIPPKMQITFGIHGVSGDVELPRKIATRTIELLPHTPYLGLGLNFDFFVAQPSGQDFSTYNRVLLGSGDYRLFQEFSSSDSKFGRYFSKDHGEARLKLDIKPVQAGPEKKDLLQFSFNFHHEVSKIDSTDRVGKLTQMIGNWDALRQYAQRLIELGSMI
jgi:hypothetical protein